MALDTFPLLIFRHFSKSFLWEWLPDKFDLTTVYFMRRLAIISLGFFIFGSSSHLASMQGDRRNSEYAFDEMRIELSDVKHALNNSKVEFEILEEKLRNQEQVIASLKKQTQAMELSKNSGANAQFSSLEKRLDQLEKFQEKMAADLRQMSSHANQALSKLQQLEQQVALHQDRLEEVVKLKSTLTSISKAINPRTDTEGPISSSSNSYRVKAGDSLEKIARAHRTSIDAIKRLNNLDKDKIIVGQELRIPSNDN